MRNIQRQQPTVVLLHSSASSARQWDRLAETLKPSFHVRAIDFHGHGEQSMWSGNAPMTLADEAALAIPALEEAGGAHVVGHSYGGAVALKLATMRPHLVRSVVVYEPVLFRLVLDEIAHASPAQGIIAVAGSMRKSLATGDANSAAQIFIDFWSGAGAWDSLPPGKQASIAPRMHAVIQHFGALLHEPLQLSELVRLRIPMMFVGGSRTPDITRRISAVLRAALPADAHEVIEALGHMGPITHSAEFNQRVVRFLDKQREDSRPALQALSAAA
jgi:pimeloyl-ACP methyl ester carboxylesterase